MFHGVPSTVSPQGSFPGNLQLVLVLRPTTLLQRTLSDILFKFNKDEFKMKVPVRNPLKEPQPAIPLRIVTTCFMDINGGNARPNCCR